MSSTDLPKGAGTGCGSVAAYIRHKRKDELACAECKAAWRNYYRAYRALGRKNKDAN
jgi:hypothetical protein